MHARELLIDTTSSIAPARALEGLDTADAERRLDTAPHTIVEIVVHLTFWQDWFLARCQGRGTPMPASASLGWVAPEPGTWPAGSARFLGGTARLVAFAETADASRPIAPALEFPPLARYTVGDVLVHVATHNAHHLGQVVLLRQLMGRWPPPSGSWTW